ncbi:MAG: YggS family pyridoxal phosphate-dependent enzyme, partial [Rubripirellula sp.]
IPEGIEVVGLMAMAGLAADSGEIQRQFDAVRELRDHLVTASGLALPELSMGMSGDFQQAIRAGATMVRIGSRLFEGLLGGH